MQLKDGVWKVEVELQDFEPEDIDISVEGGELTLMAKREIKRGNSSSFREFNEKFDIRCKLVENVNEFFLDFQRGYSYLCYGYQ